MKYGEGPHELFTGERHACQWQRGGGPQVLFFFQAARGRQGLATTRGGLVPTKYVRKSGGSDYCAAKWEPCARGAMTNVAC